MHNHLWSNCWVESAWLPAWEPKFPGYTNLCSSLTPSYPNPQIWVASGNSLFICKAVWSKHVLSLSLPRQKGLCVTTLKEVCHQGMQYMNRDYYFYTASKHQSLCETTLRDGYRRCTHAWCLSKGPSLHTGTMVGTSCKVQRVYDSMHRIVSDNSHGEQWVRSGTKGSQRWNNRSHWEWVTLGRDHLGYRSPQEQWGTPEPNWHFRTSDLCPTATCLHARETFATFKQAKPGQSKTQRKSQHKTILTRLTKINGACLLVFWAY